MKNLIFKSRFLVLFVGLLTMCVTQVWGAEKTATFTMKNTGQSSPVTVNGVTFTWTSSNIVVGTNNGSGFKANSNMTITIPAGKKLTGIEKGNGNTWGSGAQIDVYAGSSSSGTKITTITKDTHTYTVSSNNTGTTYYFANTSSKNAWLNTLTIKYDDGASSTPTLKVSSEALDFGNVESGSNKSLNTLTVSGSNLTNDISLSITGTNAGLFSITNPSPATISKGTGTVSATAVTIQYAPNTTGAHTATLNISSSGAEVKSVTLSGTGIAPVAKYTVTWHIGSGTQTTENVADQTAFSSLSAPEVADNAAGSCANKFMGWATSAISGTTDAAGFNAKKVTGDTKVTSTCKDFYAVFATGSAGGPVTYTKITKSANLVDGTYLLSTGSRVYAGQNSTNNYANSVAGTASSDKYTSLPSGAKEVQLTWNNEHTAFSLFDGTSYLKMTGDNTSLIFTNEQTFQWCIYGGTTYVDIQNTSYTSRYIKCNTGSSNRFATYGSSTNNTTWVSPYLKSGGSTYTDYLTECCTPLAAPTNLQSSPTGTGGTISWDDVAGATGYEVKIGSDDWTSVGIVGTSYTITGKECGGNNVTWQVRATGTGSYCAEGAACAEQQFETASCACTDTYSFHFGTEHQDDWNATNYCFVNSGVSDGNSGTYYYVENFELPNKPNFYVGWAGSWNTEYWYSANVAFSTMPLHHLHSSKTLGTYGSGNNIGAIGTLCIRSSYNDNNKYIDFIPGGYVLKIGSSYTSYALNPLSADIRETVWQTDLMTLTADMINNKAQVLLKTASGSVWSPNMSSDATVKGSMGQKSGASTWGSNLNTVDIGKKGKFRIWADNAGANWNLHFVPYVQATFDANGGTCATAALPAAPISVEETAANRTITLPEATKAGHSLKWSDGVNEYNAGAEVVLTADKAFTAQWTAESYSITYNDLNGATNSNPTSYTIETATITLQAPGERAGYRFDGWYTEASGAGSKVTQITTGSTGNKVVYANWTAIYAVRFEENGSVDGTKTVYLAVGQETTLPSTTISDCNEYDTFEGWVVGEVEETTTKPGSVLAGGASYTLASAGDVTLKALYSKCVGSGPEVYEKVTSAPGDWSGQYLIVSENDGTPYAFNGSLNTVASLTAKDNNYSVTISDNKISATPMSSLHDISVTIAAGTGTNAGKYSIKTASGFYIGGNGASNGLNAHATDPYYSSFAMDGDKNVLITNGSLKDSDLSKPFQLMYLASGSGSPVFKFYPNTQKKIQLYILSGGCLKSYATNPSCETPDDYTITYDVNSLYGGNSAARVTDTKDWNVGTTIKDIAECDGFAATNARGEFVGWNTNADGSGTAYEVGATIKNKNLTLFAQWENHYYVNFYDGSHMTPAEIAPIRQTTAGQTIDISGVNGTLACGSYNFVGWATNSTVYNDNMPEMPTIVTEVTPTSADINVYALYTQDAVSPDFTANCNGGNYYIKALNDMKVASDVESNYGLYEYGWYSTNREEPYGNVFSISKVTANTYVIIANRTGEYLEHSNSTPTLATVDNAANPGAAYRWTIEASDVDGRGAWRVGYYYNEKNYNFYWYNNHFRSGLKSNVTSSGDYYNLDFTPAGGASSYNSNPNCAPYRITFVTNGGTMTAPAGLTLNLNGNQYETGAIAAGSVTDFSLTAVSYPGWTFEGWRKSSAQDDVTSRPLGLLAAGDEESVNNTTTYYAVYSKLDEDKTFDPDVEDTYNVYGLNGATKVFFPVTDLPTRVGTMGTVTGVNTCSGAADVRIVPGSGEHAGQYQIFVSDGTNDQCLYGKAGETGLGEKDDTWWYIRNSTSGKGSYRIISVAEDAKEYLSQRALGFYTSTGSFQHMDVSSNLNNAGQTMYRDVEIGVCQEMHYTSTPVLTPTITLRGAPMVTSYKDKGIQATEKILVTASNFPANQKLYVTFDNADVKVLTGAGTDVTKNGDNYYFSVDGTGALVNKELTIVYTPSAFGDGSINTVTITVADNVDPAATENKASRSTIQVRNLWEKFVVAQEVAGEWYALPSMTNSYTNPDAVKVTVAGQTATVPTPISNTHAWKLDVTGQAANKNTIEFVSTLGGKYVKTNEASATTIGAYGKQSGEKQNYTEFLPVTTDLTNYQLKNTAYPSTFLGVDGDKKWGVYGTEATVQFFEYSSTMPVYTVTYHDAEGDDQTEEVTHGGNPIMTDIAARACSDANRVFIGWSETEVAVQQTEPTLVIPTDFTITAAKDFYAVYASKNGNDALFEEDFDGSCQLIWNVENAPISDVTAASCSAYSGSKYARMNMKSCTSYIQTTTKISKFKKLSFYAKPTGGISNMTTEVAYSENGSSWTVMGTDGTWPIGEYRQHSTVELRSPVDAYVRIKVVNTSSTQYYLCVDDIKIYSDNVHFYYTDYATSCEKAASMTLTYDAQGGTAQTAVTTAGWVTLPTGAECERGCYTLTGWTCSATSEVYEPGAKYLFNHDVTMTAQWETNRSKAVTVTYHTGLEGATTQTVDNVHCGDILSEVQVPTPAACGQNEFAGWAIGEFADAASADGLDKYTVGTAVMGDMELHAIWKKGKSVFTKYTETDVVPGTYILVEPTTSKALSATLVPTPITVDGTTITTDERFIQWTVAKVGEQFSIHGMDGYLNITADKTNALGISNTAVETWNMKESSTNGVYNIGITFGSSDRRVCYNSTKDKWLSYKNRTSGNLYKLSGDGPATFTMDGFCPHIYHATGVEEMTSGKDVAVMSTTMGTIIVENTSVVPVAQKVTGDDVFTITVNPTSTGANGDGSLNYSYSVKFTPTAGNQTYTATYKFIGSAETEDAKHIASEAITFTGYSLPDEFAIVINRGGQYYALPGGIASAGTPNAVPVTVVDGEVVDLGASDAYHVGSGTVAAEDRATVRLITTAGALWATNADNANINDYNGALTAANISSASEAAKTQTQWTLERVYNESTDAFEGYHLSSDANAAKALFYQSTNNHWGYYNNSYYSGDAYNGNIFFMPIAAQVGELMDIIDWSNNSVVLNMNGYRATVGAWGVKNEAGTMLLAGNRATDRTLEVSTATLVADQYLNIKVYRNANNAPAEPVVESNQNYRIPHVMEGSQSITSAAGFSATSILYVKSGTTTVNVNLTVAKVVVCPGAELKVTSGKTLTCQELVLRTTPWESGAVEGSVAATNTYYTRIINKQDAYYHFALPYQSDINSVFVSNHKNTPYGNTWILKEYNGATRAASGVSNSGANWDYLDKDVSTTIKATTGYEMFSNSNYYREFYFPVTPTPNTRVSLTAYGNESTPKSDRGWNAVCSPVMNNFDYQTLMANTHMDPSDGLKVSELVQAVPEYVYWQHVPSVIHPAIPFYVQVESNTVLDFSAPQQSPVALRRLAAATSLSTQWLQLEYADAAGEMDEANIYINQEKFTIDYETGYDVAKQTLTASRPIIYTQLPCGNLAFAAIPDSLAETRIPLAVSAPAEGEMTFSLRENRWLERLEHVFLVDETLGFATDLLEDAYTYDAQAGTTVGRFYLQAVFKAPGIATDMETIDSGGGTIVVSHDGSRIVVSGLTSGTEVRLYDAVGHLMSQTKAAGESVDMRVPVTGVYLMQVGEHVNKLILNK